MKVLAIVNSLDRGGAETNLVRLAVRLRANDIDVAVLPLRAGGTLRGEAVAAGVHVLPGGLRALMRAWLHPPARVVEGWLYVGAVVASLFRLRRSVVVWNLRHVPADVRAESLTTRCCLWLMRRVPRPDRIHANSNAAIERHRALGIAGDYRLVPNGIDTDRFRHDAAAARRFREAALISEQSALVVHIGRAHPHKGHRVLFDAMAPLLKDRPDLVLACVGPGVGALALDEMCRMLPMAQVRLVDALPDVVGALSAAHVVVSASLTESSPTALAEAMSCGAVCVATDVGDSAALLVGAGLIVPANDAVALSDAIRAALALTVDERRSLGERARRTIAEKNDVARCSAAYAESIRQVAGAA